MREVYPTKYYRDEGFVEYKVEIKDEDREEIIEEYLARHADFEFDELAIVNNRPFNIWVYATCRRYVDPDDPEGVVDAEVEVRGEYDGNPTGA